MDNQQITDALTNLLLAVITLVTALVSVVVLPWIRSKANAQQIENARAIVAQAVAAVEQMGARNGWTPETKLIEAMTRARDMAATKGITLSDSQLHSLIEQAVLALKQVSGSIFTDPTTPKQ